MYFLVRKNVSFVIFYFINHSPSFYLLIIYLRFIFSCFYVASAISINGSAIFFLHIFPPFFKMFVSMVLTFLCSLHSPFFLYFFLFCFLLLLLTCFLFLSFFFSPFILSLFFIFVLHLYLKEDPQFLLTFVSLSFPSFIVFSRSILLFHFCVLFLRYCFIPLFIFHTH